MGFKTTLQEVEDFFMGIVYETVQFREANNVSRNDFMDLLIKIKNSKKHDDSDAETMGGISMEELAAQVIFWYSDLSLLITQNKKVFCIFSRWL